MKNWYFEYLIADYFLSLFYEQAVVSTPGPDFAKVKARFGQVGDQVGQVGDQVDQVKDHWSRPGPGAWQWIYIQ